jgi:hypothetical protein
MVTRCERLVASRRGWSRSQFRACAGPGRHNSTITASLNLIHGATACALWPSECQVTMSDSSLRLDTAPHPLYIGRFHHLGDDEVDKY